MTGPEDFEGGTLEGGNEPYPPDDDNHGGGKPTFDIESEESSETYEAYMAEVNADNSEEIDALKAELFDEGPEEDVSLDNSSSEVGGSEQEVDDLDSIVGEMGEGSLDDYADETNDAYEGDSLDDFADDEGNIDDFDFEDDSSEDDSSDEDFDVDDIGGDDDSADDSSDADFDFDVEASDGY